MKYLIAFTIIALVVISRFDDELKIPRFCSTFILTFLLTTALIYRKRVLQIRPIIGMKNKSLVLLVYIGGLVCSMIGIFSGSSIGGNAALFSRIIFWLLVSPILYLMTVELFEGRD